MVNGLPASHRARPVGAPDASAASAPGATLAAAAGARAPLSTDPPATGGCRRRARARRRGAVAGVIATAVWHAAARPISPTLTIARVGEALSREALLYTCGIRVAFGPIDHLAPVRSFGELSSGSALLTSRRVQCGRDAKGRHPDPEGTTAAPCHGQHFAKAVALTGPASPRRRRIRPRSRGFPGRSRWWRRRCRRPGRCPRGRGRGPRRIRSLLP